jgi:hypothetical protein
VYLGDEQFLDLDDARERARGRRRTVFAQRRDGGVQLVQNLLEPQLVSLMDGDEEQFVVVRRVRETLLQPDQIGHAQIFVV